jgi:glyoxylase-like metal-dependent hydrolase (beta-lactamase superfamily II)
MTREMRNFSGIFRRPFRLALAVLLGLVSGASVHLAAAPQGQTDGKVELLHVQGNVYVISGAGANITVQVGEQVVTVVDAGVAQKSDQVLALIRSVTDKHIIFVIDTSMDADHIGGNENLSKAGWTLPNASMNPLVKENPTGLSLAPGAAILSHISVLNKMSATAGTANAIPAAAWPTDTYDTDLWKLYNSEGVFLYHPLHAHTDGDTFVFFRRSDVVSTGDIFTLASYPVIDAQQGGNINGEIDALNQILDLLEAEENEEGGTYVIPGHGHICDRNDVVNYRDMLTIIRGRLWTMMACMARRPARGRRTCLSRRSIEI